jgi:hypothetical protein
VTAGTLDVGVGYAAHYSDWSDDEDDGVLGPLDRSTGK